MSLQLAMLVVYSHLVLKH